MYKPTGVKEASVILGMSNKFIIYYDPDIDGAVSGELIRRFLVKFKRPFLTYINENRAHGFKMTEEQIDKAKGYTIFVVDSLMTEEEIVYLTSRGLNIINIDHHHLKETEFVYHTDEVTGCKGVIINNQYPFEPEEYRFLSGAGVIYYVLQRLVKGLCGLDEKLLVGLSLLSDIRPLESPIAKDFLYTTFNHQSALSEHLISCVKDGYDFGFGEQTFDRNFIDFTFSPKVNSLFRLNKGSQAMNLFAGMQVDPLEMTVNRNIQNAVRDAIIDNLEGHEYSNLIFKWVDKSLEMPYTGEISNFIGVACSKVMNGGKTTILFVRDNGKITRGSLRGACDDVDYLAILNRNGFVGVGHKNAFGIVDMDWDVIDMEKVNQEIADAEDGYLQRKYKGRILEVNDLSFFVRGKHVNIAEINNYVRDNQRYYIKYVGNNIERYQRGKAIEFTVDGLKVLSFDEELNLKDDLILPLIERGKYINFYMKKY